MQSTFHENQNLKCAPRAKIFLNFLLKSRKISLNLKGNYNKATKIYLPYTFKIYPTLGVNPPQLLKFSPKAIFYSQPPFFAGVEVGGYSQVLITVEHISLFFSPPRPTHLWKKSDTTNCLIFSSHIILLSPYVQNLVK